MEGLGVDEDLSYEEVPDEILDRQIKRQRSKEIATVKVLWRNYLVEGATWEAEADMRSCYPHIFNLEVRLPILKSLFPYPFVFFSNQLTVHSDYAVI